MPPLMALKRATKEINSYFLFNLAAGAGLIAEIMKAITHTSSVLLNSEAARHKNSVINSNRDTLRLRADKV
jgi:hypothetical protein